MVLLAGMLLALALWMLLGQGLAFVGAFRLPWALGLYLLALYPLTRWYTGDPSSPLTFPPPRPSLPRPLAWLLALAGWSVVGLALVPLLAWPVLTHRYQPWVLWDVVYYHLPKAVDLLQKGHMWNLALPYGQYPIGWETWLALLVGLHRNALGLGILSAWVVFMWALTMWTLMRQYGRLPSALAAFVVGVLVVAVHVGWRWTPWHVMSLLALDVGKNDLVAAVLVLAGLLHAAPERLHRRGFLLYLAAAWAVKPMAGAFLLAVWGFWLGRMAGAERRAWLMGGGLAWLLGSLWLLRNLVVMGRPFSPIASILQKRALLWHVFLPEFWQLPRYQLLFITGVVLGMGLWAWYQPSWRYRAGLLAGLYGLLLITPAVVLPGKEKLIQWRFALALLSWMWVLLASWVVEVWPWERLGFRRGAWFGLLVVLGLLGGAIYARVPRMWQWEPRAAWLIEDPFLEPPGSGPYRSVFDYIDSNLQHARIEAGVPFYYLYDPALTNEGVRPGHFPAGMPWVVPQPQPTHRLFCSLQWTWRGEAHVRDSQAVQEQKQRWQRQGYRILYSDPACVLAQISVSP